MKLIPSFGFRMIPKFTVAISLQKKRLLLFIKMRFHPQKQQIKNRRWKNKIGFLLFSFVCFASATVVRKKQGKLSIRWRKIWEIRMSLYFLSFFIFVRCRQRLWYQHWPQGGICANTCKVFMFSSFLTLIHTNNVAAGAVMGQFSLPVHPKMPEDKQMRTGGTRESIDVGSKPSLLQV